MTITGMQHLMEEALVQEAFQVFNLVEAFQIFLRTFLVNLQEHLLEDLTLQAITEVQTLDTILELAYQRPIPE